MNFDYKRMIKFEHNVGCKDKQRRIYTGSAALLVSVFFASIPLLLIGLILVATGYTGWCPVYSGLHRNTNETCETEEKASEEAAN
jgi:hypothetical protein